MKQEADAAQAAPDSKAPAQDAAQDAAQDTSKDAAQDAGKEAAKDAAVPDPKADAAEKKEAKPELSEAEKKAQHEKLVKRNKMRINFTLNLIMAVIFACAVLLQVNHSITEKIRLGALDTFLAFLISLPLALVGVYIGRKVKDFYEPSGETDERETFGWKLILRIVWPYVFFFVIVVLLTLLPYVIIGRNTTIPA
ncbi:MAG: hypothetical protein LBF40_00750 [Deltaproteobacteria bacterium]|nr:hypothetical protein [Deltaproteobacteria bacterium]